MKQKLLRTALMTGTAAALVIGAFSVALYALGLNPFGQYKLMFMPLYALVLMAGLWRFRMRHMGGYLHGWQGVSLGTLAALVAAAFYAVLIYVLLTFLIPDMLAVHKADLNAWLLKNQNIMRERFGEAAYRESLRAAENITPADIALDEWIKTTLVGLVIGTALGLFFKKTPPAEGNASAN